MEVALVLAAGCAAVAMIAAIRAASIGEKAADSVERTMRTVDRIENLAIKTHGEAESVRTHTQAHFDAWAAHLTGQTIQLAPPTHRSGYWPVGSVTATPVPQMPCAPLVRTFFTSAVDKPTVVKGIPTPKSKKS